VRRAAALVALLALLVVPTARADGDPASDILFRDNVFLSLQSPQQTAKGKELVRLTAAAAKQGFVLKVAVVQAPTDLGAIPQLFGRASKYAKFLRMELTWGGFKGTLVVVMNGKPGGVAVVGPGAPLARNRLSKLTIPPKATLDQLADVAIRAVRIVTAANHVSLAEPRAQNNQTRDRLIIGGGLLAVIALAVLASRLLRRRRKNQG
jgi:hypothetical protein